MLRGYNILEIYERIKLLRKEYLNLTQQEFATKIKISRANLANIEVGRINITDRVISDICSAFNTNKKWLYTGNGEVFKDIEIFSLDDYAREKKLSDLEISIIKAYMSLNPSTRRDIMQHLKSIFMDHTYLDAENAHEEETIDIEKEVENYRRELEEEKRTKMFPVLHENFAK